MQFELRYMLPCLAAAVSVTACSPDKMPSDVIYSSEEFTVYTDSVVQGPFTAKAVSRDEIVTTYESPEQSGFSRLLRFRLSLNSRDNELRAGKSHAVLIGTDTTFTFGELMHEVDSLKAAADYGQLHHDARWTLRVNMKPVFDSFGKRGYYVTPTNDTIYADDFKGVWVAGSVEPLTWDFENLYGKHDRKLEDRGDGIYEVTLTLNPVTDRPDNPTGWKADSVLADMPAYHSDQMLVDALFNMSMHEIKSNLRADGTYRAGKEWDGVWTRDVSYSAWLSLAMLDPTGTWESLRAKLKTDASGRSVIIQDTGTGGSWPVSSDRVVWAMAAWEVYKMLGDKSMLEVALPAIDNTLNDDMNVVWNPSFKLMRGEQSYLDWREQTYPRWMQPKDIYESMCLGTNVMFAEAFKVRDLMNAVDSVKSVSPMWSGVDKDIANAINTNLWIPNLGYYSEYLYGGVYPIQSAATDNLGQALAVIFGVANREMARSIISKTPYTPYGISSVYPQIPDIKPYHNNAVWPFVQAYWNLAAKKAGNMEAFEKGLAAMMRAAAMFGTNKELFVADNGDYRGTAVNSDSQLWSCTGMAAMVLRGIIGMDFRPDGVVFAPFVPRALTGTKVLENFRYRDAVLHVSVAGTGANIKAMTVNGMLCENHFLPDTVTGNVDVVITLDDKPLERQTINNQPQEWMPSTPDVEWHGDDKAKIGNYREGIAYDVWINSSLLYQSDAAAVDIASQKVFSLVDVVPVRAEKFAGFTGRPHELIPEGSLTVVSAAGMDAKTGTSFIKDSHVGDTFVELTRTRNTTVNFEAQVDSAGEYFVDVRYANGCGPINTDNKCAIRMLYVNDARVGAVVMPQRGIDEWLSTGYSNMIPVTLRKGVNRFSLRMEQENMNGEVNTALVRYVRIIRK